MMVYIWQSTTIPIIQLDALHKAQPQFCATDALRFLGSLLALSTARRGIIELGAAAWLSFLHVRRRGYDRTSDYVLGVQLTALTGSYWAGIDLAWWALYTATLASGIARRYGLPPLPILVGHLNLDDGFRDLAVKRRWEAYTKSRRGQMAGWTQVPLTSADGVELFCCKFELPGAKRWCLFFNGNAMLAQDSLPEHEAFALKLKTNVLAFNCKPLDD